MFWFRIESLPIGNNNYCFKLMTFALFEKLHSSYLIWNLHPSVKLLAMLSAVGKFNKDPSNMYINKSGGHARQVSHSIAA